MLLYALAVQIFVLNGQNFNGVEISASSKPEGGAKLLL